MNRFLLYRGPSRLDPDRWIRVVLTAGRSKNRKTGDIPQVWILDDWSHPVDARRSGANRSVCGECPMWKPCYVQWEKAPAGVWNATHEKGGRYVDLRDGCADWSRAVRCVADRRIRVGAAGDPAAAPHWVWRRLRKRFTCYGYTHQWRVLARPVWGWLMASADCWQDHVEASAIGWRTFRTKRGDAEDIRDRVALDSEVVCPFETHGVQCIDCKLCEGDQRPEAKSVVVQIHGKACSKAAKQVFVQIGA